MAERLTQAAKSLAVPVTFWSRPGASRADAALREPAATGKPKTLAFTPDGRFYTGRLEAPRSGTLVLDLACPRPLRVWIGGVLMLDEGLYWRSFDRQVFAAVVVPAAAGSLEFVVEVGSRPRHPESVDRDCPSRNRARVVAELERRLPDRLKLAARVTPGVAAPAASLRFLPTQFRDEGIVWQHLLVRPVRGAGMPPSTALWGPADERDTSLAFATSILPCQGRELTGDRERQVGVRRFAVPVAEPQDMPRPVRGAGLEKRVEPAIEVARALPLTLEGADGAVTLSMPAFETLGRHAPRQEFRAFAWPTLAQARAGVPEPVLPDALAPFKKTYDAAWDMLLNLVRHPDPHSGLPGSYISTGAGFMNHQFVWDTSFAALCTRYGCRVLDPFASLNLLYSRQFDGGYIHREHDVRDGTPALYEPDFSPNPPIMSVAEWAIAGVTGDVLRLRRVYPLLKAQHAWLQRNRQLPDGTYWTTGLANGLDNSPSLGDGYPDLTAQMAHEAETLGRIAACLGFGAEAQAFRKEHQALARACNKHLWSETQRIYATSLPGGGHNPNKVVTAFWPLWAGIVPADRVEALARHLKDPRSFWRHHPIPSLAADSPHFRPAGDYWLGSTWSPTNYAAIKGFDRAGRHDLAVEASLRHLQCVTEVLNDTGFIWENYCSEASRKGSWSGANYCWSALGPVALLLEVIIGLEPDALNNRLKWMPPADQVIGVRRLPLGAATVSIVQRPNVQGGVIEVETDRAFTLELTAQGATRRMACAPGFSRLALTK